MSTVNRSQMKALIEHRAVILKKKKDPRTGQSFMLCAEW